VTSERTKRLPERTPPRPRRLSLENASSGKGSIPGKVPKSPIPVMKFNKDRTVNVALNNLVLFDVVVIDISPYYSS
jgi:hypothetical protein